MENKTIICTVLCGALTVGRGQGVVVKGKMFVMDASKFNGSSKSYRVASTREVIEFYTSEGCTLEEMSEQQRIGMTKAVHARAAKVKKQVGQFIQEEKQDLELEE